MPSLCVDDPPQAAVCVLETRNLRKEYGSDDLIVPALRGVDIRVREGGVSRHHGALGLRKEHVAAHSWGVETPTQWPGALGRPRSGDAGRRPPDDPPPHANGLYLPVV